MLGEEKGEEEMHCNIDKEVCDSCYEDGILIEREYYSLISTTDDKIVWYECGHVLIIQDGVVQQQYNYHKE